MLIACVQNMPGGNLWNNNGRSEGYCDVPNIGSWKYMKQYQFKELKHMLSYLWSNPNKEGVGKWWQIIHVEEIFAENRKKNILSSNIKTLDKSMSAFHQQTLVTGNLAHLWHILQKPEDLGTEFKNLTCAHIYVMLCIKLCRGKNNSNGKQLVDEYKKKTTACCMQLLKRSFQCKYLRDRDLTSLVALNSFPLSTDALLALSTPTATGSMDSFYTFSTRTFIEMSKHQIWKTERKVKSRSVGIWREQVIIGELPEDTAVNELRLERMKRTQECRSRRKGKLLYTVWCVYQVGSTANTGFAMNVLWPTKIEFVKKSWRANMWCDMVITYEILNFPLWPHIILFL